MMVRFALDGGAEFGDELRGQIATLDRWLKGNGMATISGLPAGLISDAAVEAGDQAVVKGGGTDPIDLIFQVHAQLAKLVHPATPYSLRATDTRRHGLGRLRDLPVVVKLAIVAAAICMLGFFITLCTPSENRSATLGVPPPNAGSYTTPGQKKISVESLLTGINDKGFWNSIFGAGLGAAFYILLKTQKYIANQSYDPRYNNVYLARLATGVVSGFILSNMARSYLGSPEAGLAEFTPGMIAILGGFSAEAVEEVLQRMIEVMVTAVRGDGAAQTRAEVRTAKAELGAELSRRSLAVRQRLAELDHLETVDAATLKQALADVHSLLK